MSRNRLAVRKAHASRRAREYAQLLLHRLTEVRVRHDRVLRDFRRKLFVKVGRVNCALLHHVSIVSVVSGAHAYPDMSRFEPHPDSPSSYRNIRGRDNSQQRA